MSSYQNHHLLSNLQLWRDRLYNSPRNRFDHYFNDFFDKITSNKKLFSIIQDIKKIHKYELSEIFTILKKPKELFYKKYSKDNLVCLCYYILQYSYERKYTDDLVGWSQNGQNSSTDKIKFGVENFVDPFVNFLFDELDEDNTVLYLFEKYKKRTEWFTRKSLIMNSINNLQNTL